MNRRVVAVLPVLPAQDIRTAASEGDWTFAARLHGATEVLIQQLGTRREPTDEASVAPLIVKTRQMLGERAFAGQVQSRSGATAFGMYI